MEIPSDPCFTPQFRRRLQSFAWKLVRTRFDPGHRGFDRQAFVDDLIAETDARILAKDQTASVRNWLAYYFAVMTNIVREHAKQTKRNPLASSDDVDDHRADVRFAVVTTYTDALPIRNRIAGLLRAFCRENAALMHGAGLDPVTFPQHWIRLHELELPFRDYCDRYPAAPKKSTFWRWDVAFRCYARRHWDDVPPAEQPARVAAVEGRDEEKK